MKLYYCTLFFLLLFTIIMMIMIIIFKSVTKKNKMKLKQMITFAKSKMARKDEKK